MSNTPYRPRCSTIKPPLICLSAQNIKKNIDDEKDHKGIGISCYYPRPLLLDRKLDRLLQFFLLIANRTDNCRDNNRDPRASQHKIKKKNLLFIFYFFITNNLLEKLNAIYFLLNNQICRRRVVDRRDAILEQLADFRPLRKLISITLVVFSLFSFADSINAQTMYYTPMLRYIYIYKYTHIKR